MRRRGGKHKHCLGPPAGVGLHDLRRRRRRRRRHRPSVVAQRPWRSNPFLLGNSSNCGSLAPFSEMQ